MVELKQPFVCPSCGSTLSPPVVKESSPILLLAAAGAAAVLIIAALAFLLLSGKSPPSPPKPPTPAPAVAAKPEPSPPPPPAAALPAIVGSSSPAGPTTAGITMPPPAPQPPGNPAAAAAAPAGASSDVEAKAGAAKAGAAGATEAGPAAPTTPATQANPPAAPREAPAPPHHSKHRIVATPHAASRGGKQAQPDMQALDGSHPDYPDLYEETGEKGEVTVTCMVQINGHAEDCQIIKQSGGGAFARAVLHWLERDTTRFPPLLKRGRPAVLPFTWTIEFFP